MTYHPDDLRRMARIALAARVSLDPRYRELVYHLQHALGMTVEEIELNIVRLAQ